MEHESKAARQDVCALKKKKKKTEKTCLYTPETVRLVLTFFSS